MSSDNASQPARATAPLLLANDAAPFSLWRSPRLKHRLHHIPACCFLRLFLLSFSVFVFLQRFILAWEHSVGHEQPLTSRAYHLSNSLSNPRRSRVIANRTTPAMTSQATLRQQGSLHFRHILLLRLVNALTIATFFQPDEYFQALEPAYQVAFGAQSNTWVTWVSILFLV